MNYGNQKQGWKSWEWDGKNPALCCKRGLLHSLIHSFTEHLHRASGSDLDKARSLILRHSQQEGVAVEKYGENQGESCPRISSGTWPRLAGILAPWASPATSKNESHKGIWMSQGLWWLKWIQKLKLPLQTCRIGISKSWKIGHCIFEAGSLNILRNLEVMTLDQGRKQTPPWTSKP